MYILYTVESLGQMCVDYVGHLFPRIYIPIKNYFFNICIHLISCTFKTTTKITPQWTNEILHAHEHWPLRIQNDSTVSDNVSIVGSFTKNYKQSFDHTCMETGDLQYSIFLLPIIQYFLWATWKIIMYTFTKLSHGNCVTCILNWWSVDKL